MDEVHYGTVGKKSEKNSLLSIMQGHYRYPAKTVFLNFTSSLLCSAELFRFSIASIHISYPDTKNSLVFPVLAHSPVCIGVFTAESNQ